ncbi:hypothetical protein EJ04DRAFT_579521 [Polyplosphaeria fusca]|uniref:Uncharacterized protein n=1 Tax=Polyplosphaeria fusca TaxID=682080 RepID=A0A9P4QTW5_9PLEO|nr:hypothetical protein EJ04DRAFT_579521 [Polyplosphaeria fusca]
MSELDPQYVRKGFWINEAAGPTMGKTITTDTRTGTIVIVLLTLVSTLASTHLWQIVLFLFHHFRCRDSLADALFRQEQAYLRTQPSPVGLLANHIKLWWTWRGRNSSKHVFQLLPQLLLAVFFAVLGIAASILSSYIITSNGIEVLVSSPYCGTLQSRPPKSAVWNEYLTATTQVMNAVTDGCYLSEPTGAECQRMISPRISFTTNEVECPFDASVCKENVTAVQLDSGLQDVNPGFGLNLPDRDKVFYRKVSTCAVLSHENRTKVYNLSDVPDPIKQSLNPLDQQVMLFDYGPSVSWEVDETFSVSLLASNYSTSMSVKGQQSFNSPDMYPFSTFNATGALFRSNADVFLRIIAMNSAYFYAPVNDPIFSAHRVLSNHLLQSGVERDLYGGDFPAEVIGCALQHQFCVKGPGSSGPVCSDLMSLPGTVDKIGLANATDLQQSVLEVILVAAFAFDMSNFETLRAQSEAGIGRFNIPDNQWVKELQAWESSIWAALQIEVSDYAIGPQVRMRNLTSAYGINLANTTAEEQLCRMQRMRKSGGFANINVFGLAFVITFAFVVAILDLVLLRFLIYLGKFRKALSPRLDQWIQDGVYQLQRQTYQARGEGTWSRLDQEIPVTEDGELLDMLTRPHRQMTSHVPGLAPKYSMPLTLVASNRSADELPKKEMQRPVTDQDDCGQCVEIEILDAGDSTEEARDNDSHAHRVDRP